MIQISNIMEQNHKNPLFDRTNIAGRRPFIKVSYDQFCSRLVRNGNQLLFSRGISRRFELSPKNEDLIKQLYLYATCNETCLYDLNKGLFFMGSIGAGKTLLMKAFLMIFNQEEYSKNVRILSATDYVELVSRDGNPIQDLRKKPLFIDDLGKEADEIKVYGKDIRPFAELLPIRYESGGITFFTSNYNLESLSKFYGLHIVDRLREMCTFITITGESRRH
ncbi:hypothetical protein C8N47_105152 [Mangrovibacterium marinum]|uniref:DNA replication protein DnaC n=1 Tax=Mangrovibacterium marinum TaxID=1639118 RepID=A0A2T5C3F6_9BACT|nr:hypothetical protein [Mangrovibacterium marinum]PTN09311.1 hypothetical protein C8N47_105152 [Mangrovibacterium marinum]